MGRVTGEDWGNDLTFFASDFKISVMWQISSVRDWGTIGDLIGED